MKTVLVYLKKGNNNIENAVYIMESFSFLAFIIGPIWLLVNRLWIQFITFSLLFVIIFQLSEYGIIGSFIANVCYLILYIYIGINYSDYKRYKLEKNNYDLKDIIIANSLEEAKYKFLSKNILIN